MRVDEPASPTDDGVTADVSPPVATPTAASMAPISANVSKAPPAARVASGLRELPGVLISGAKLGLISALSVLLAAGLMVGLIAFGLLAFPTYGVATFATDSPPRRPPI